MEPPSATSSDLECSFKRARRAPACHGKQSRSMTDSRCTCFSNVGLCRSFLSAPLRLCVRLLSDSPRRNGATTTGSRSALLTPQSVVPLLTLLYKYVQFTPAQQASATMQNHARRLLFHNLVVSESFLCGATSLAGIYRHCQAAPKSSAAKDLLQSLPICSPRPQVSRRFGDLFRPTSMASPGVSPFAATTWRFGHPPDCPDLFATPLATAANKSGRLPQVVNNQDGRP
jgi:hypothetical protein